MVKNNSIYKGVLKALSVYFRAHTSFISENGMNSLSSEGCKDRAGDYLQREFS